ncbi:MAG: methylcrotonoyl-CoA carboxylase [Flavobacteriales bacterium]|nr:methylcrotonoyl-CoA carboxylase [Flavobacteriales bacterium]|tara:strand:+ start:4947 stop:6572 length:1626 start_codon:yes stop_codon:yes gene_type:complete
MDLNFNKNEDSMKLLVSEMKQKKHAIELGGGKENIAKQHKKGKLTARERIKKIFDKNSKTIELGIFAANDLYLDFGGCPSAGVIIAIGEIHNKNCIVVANDATVKAGAWFPMTAKKNLRAQEICIENNIPIIYLVDSAGVFLPLQDEIFPDKEHFGRQFRNNAKISSMGISQISAIMGSCVAGGAYLPIMSDEALIVEKTGSVFLAGSHLVKAAIGENIDNETLGGADTHCNISGVTDYKCKNDTEAINIIREIINKTGEKYGEKFSRIISNPPKKDINDIYGIIPRERDSPYEMREILERIVDDSIFQEYKANYGKTLICAYARIDGWSVGIIANERKMVKTGRGEMQLGGVIYSDAADKAARFIMNCNQKNIPLLFIQDVNGFMVGSRSEQNGIIKDGAKMVNAMSNSVVPKFTLIIGNSFGAGNYAMCGKAYDPRLILAWPTAKMAVMGGEQASKVLLNLEENKLKKLGKNLNENEKNHLLQSIQSRYEKQMSPYYAASRMWIDEIIDPLETRTYISKGIEMANNNQKKDFKTGVIQT